MGTQEGLDQRPCTYPLLYCFAWVRDITPLASLVQGDHLLPHTTRQTFSTYFLQEVISCPCQPVVLSPLNSFLCGVAPWSILKGGLCERDFCCLLLFICHASIYLCTFKAFYWSFLCVWTGRWSALINSPSCLEVFDPFWLCCLNSVSKKCI